MRLGIGFLIFILAFNASASIFVAGLGDSIMVGHNATNGFTNRFESPVGYPFGNTNMDVMQMLAANSGGRFYGTNIGHGGYTFANCNSLEMPWATASGATILFIHCGINDIASSVSWETAMTNLNGIKYKCGTNSPKMALVVDAIFPRAGLSIDPVTIRTWNTNLAVWCSTNGCRFSDSHDFMASSTNIDWPRVDWVDSGGIHLTPIGVDAWSKFTMTNLDNWFIRTATANNLNVGTLRRP